jgi:cytochrome c-type biogenesis protein CcmH
MISRNFALIPRFCRIFRVDRSIASMAEEAALAADPVAEKRLLELSNELRCLVCQNQTIADSNAELAVDLRREIRGMIQAGKTDKEIIDFMVVRYGDFVLYRPPVKGITLLLWGGPIALMLLGFFILQRYLRQRAKRVAEDQPLTADEASRAEALLKELDPEMTLFAIFATLLSWWSAPLFCRRCGSAFAPTTRQPTAKPPIWLFSATS